MSDGVIEVSAVTTADELSLPAGDVDCAGGVSAATAALPTAGRTFTGGEADGAW